MWDTIQNGYLTNHIHALDQPGEWHWQNDTLYLWTAKSSNPAGNVVEAKKRQLAFDCGYTSTYLGCIFIFNDHLNPSKQYGGHTITHCDLYNSGRAVISVFGNQSQTSFDAMEISYNRIHDGCILSNDAGLFNSWSVTLGTDSKRTQIHHNLIWDQWGQFWAGLVYPDNNSYKMEAHHNILWYSANNRYDPKGRLFWKANTPNDCSYHDNTEINNYSGGIAGLTNNDYLGGYFQTGTSFEVNVDTCLITSIKNIPAENVFDVAVYPNPVSHMVYIIPVA